MDPARRYVEGSAEPVISATNCGQSVMGSNLVNIAQVGLIQREMLTRSGTDELTMTSRFLSQMRICSGKEEARQGVEEGHRSCASGRGRSSSSSTEWRDPSNGSDGLDEWLETRF